jgi:hypothetical protein
MLLAVSIKYKVTIVSYPLGIKCGAYGIELEVEVETGVDREEVGEGVVDLVVELVLVDDV